jgi:hypothetical protein
MKKLLIFVALISLGAVAAAQVQPNALGARLYGGDTYSGAELSYQKVSRKTSPGSPWWVSTTGTGI